MVIRRKLVRPAGTFSGWAAPVTRVRAVTWPAAVLISRRVGTGRGTPSRSRRMLSGLDSVSGWLKLTWTHCPTALAGLASIQAVDGLPSNALTGSPCGNSVSQVPAEEAVTLAAPPITATVWWPAVPAGRSWRGAWPPAPCGSSAGMVPVAV